MGQIIFRHRQQSGGILVDAVDDSRPQLPIDAGEGIPHGIEQPVDQGVIRMPRRRVHHQPLGLVDHHHIRILIYNIQWNFPGGNVHRLGLRNGDLHQVPHIQPVIFLSRPSLQKDTALLHQLLDGTAAEPQLAPGQKGVQPFPGQIRNQPHFFPSFQIALLKKASRTIKRMQPQLMKQSARLNTGNSINSVSSISTT